MSASAAARTHLWARIVRVGLALWAMRGAVALDALAERLLPEDLRHSSADRDIRRHAAARHSRATQNII
jgi:hypothetical protein